MFCKFCGAEINDEHKFCHSCGKNNADVIEELQTEAVEEPVCEQDTSAEVCSEMQDFATASEQPKKKVWPLVLSVIAAVAALAALAIVLLIALGVDLKPRPNDILKKDTYIVSDEKAVDKADVIVAKIEDKELSNAQLQILYRMQVVDFVNYYSNYLSYFGFDYTQPLSEQISYFDETMTWEQYFINAAIDTWQNYQTMDETWETEFAALPEKMEEEAKAGEYENVEAMLKDVLGPACTMEDYLAYIRLVSVSQEFYATEYQKLMPTDDEAEQYFAQNEEAFAENGITKESGLVSSVRHILVKPVAEDTEDAEAEISEQAWDDCLKQAEDILAEWKSGSATEDSFATLANLYSEDGGSNTTGGLYESISHSSNYVEPFLKWSIDMTRQPGDTEIVKTEFGYHIMYFVSGEAEWIQAAKTNLLSERTTEMIDDAEARWPMKVNFRKITLSELNFS